MINIFQEYLTTSCRNAENYIRPSQDCYDYLTFKTHQISLEIEASLQHIDGSLAREGFSESQRMLFNEEAKKSLLRRVLNKTEDLHKIVRNDHFAAAHMEDISSVALTISDGIKHPSFNRKTLKPYFQRQSQRILNENKKKTI